MSSFGGQSMPLHVIPPPPLDEPELPLPQVLLVHSPLQQSVFDAQVLPSGRQLDPPHTFCTPPPPQVCPEGQVPQSSTPQQPSEMVPH